MTGTDIAASQGWSVERVAREGNAERLHVEQDGTPAILYVFEDPGRARRVAWAHGADHAAQLFVVPELIEAKDNWVLVQNIEGLPLSEYLVESGSAAITSQLAHELGENLRKLHSTNLSTESVFGDPVDAAQRWLTFNGFVAAQFERFAEDVRSLNLDDTIASAILNAIGQIRHELASFHPRSPTTLVHGKLDFSHIWVDENGRSVVGLTSFDACAILPAEVDLAWLLWIKDFEADDLARSLYRGYGAARTMDVQRRERFHRRLVAFHALYGDYGHVDVPLERLVAIVTEP
ncbi:MAG: phosphotransferase [bacterium]